MGVNGCSLTSQVSSTPRSSTEQRLLTSSLRRATAKADLSRFSGKRVSVDLVGLTADQAFAKAFFGAELKRAGASVVSDEKDKEMKLTVIASAIGVDKDQVLVGIPSVPVPLVGVSTPELALFKWVKNRGYTEFETYAFDGKTGRFVSKSAPKIGESKYDIFTVLLLISFGYTDLDKDAGGANGAGVSETGIASE